jgi:hypothetical protein
MGPFRLTDITMPGIIILPCRCRKPVNAQLVLIGIPAKRARL